MVKVIPTEKRRMEQGLTFSENVSFFIRSVYQSKYFILLLVSAITFGVYHYYSKQTPIYQAIAKLFIGREQGQNPGVTPFAEKSSESGFGSIKTHQVMMATRLVSEMVLENLKSKNINPYPSSPDPVGELSSVVRVGIVSQSDILEVGIEHVDPKMAALLADSVAEAYSQLLVFKGSREIAGSVTLLRNEMSNLKKRLDEDQSKVKLFELANPKIREVGILEEQIKSMRAELVKRNSEKSDLTTNLEEIKSLKTEQSGKDWKEAVVSYPIIANDPVIQGIIQKLYQKELDLAKSKELFQEKYPEVQTQLTEVSTLRKLLASRVERIVDELKSKHMFLLTRIQQLEKDVKDGEDDISILFSKRVEYKALTGDVEISQQLYDVLRERINQADILGRVRQTPAMLVSRAVVPGIPFKPKVKRNTLLALLVSLAGSMYLSFIYYMNKHTVQREEDVLEYLKLPFLGQIPRLAEVEVNTTLLAQMEGLERDTIHIVSQNLQMELKKEDIKEKVLLVTSTDVKEGKTFVTINLGAQLALKGKKILLIGGDFRSPQLANILNVEVPERGLENYIRNGKMEPSDLVHPTQLANLFVMDNKTVVESPLELIDSEKFYQLIHGLAPRFDLILVDTPPLGLFYDCDLIARRFPSVIFVMRENTVACARINRVLARLERKDIRVLGGIINARSMNFLLFPVGLYYQYSSYYESMNPIRREIRRIYKRIARKLYSLGFWFVHYKGIFPRQYFLGIPIPGFGKKKERVISFNPSKSIST